VFYQRAKENALLHKLGLSAINWNPNQPQQPQGEQAVQCRANAAIWRACGGFDAAIQTQSQGY
jgi:hypothetical protein